MNQRSIRKIADFLAHRPIGRIVTAIPVEDDDYVISIEDRRDGREHVMHTVGDLQLWLESFEQGRVLQPTKAFCDCCGGLHSDRDVDDRMFELCINCQTELTAASLEEEAA